MARQLPQPRRTDPYRSSDKPKGHPQCPDCSAISTQGRWVPEAAAKRKKVQADGSLLCPACRQAREHYALSVVEIHGQSWKMNQDQILSTIQNTERVARTRNDQERVLSIRTFRDTTKVYVTLPTLARQLARELVREFKGTLELHRSSEEPFVRLIWDSDHIVRKGAPGVSKMKQSKDLKNSSHPSRHRGSGRVIRTA